MALCHVTHIEQYTFSYVYGTDNIFSLSLSLSKKKGDAKKSIIIECIRNFVTLTSLYVESLGFELLPQ
jgi:hypothetical protein